MGFPNKQKNPFVIVKYYANNISKGAYYKQEKKLLERKSLTADHRKEEELQLLWNMVYSCLIKSHFYPPVLQYL